MISFATNFLMKSLKNITFLKGLDERSKILFLPNNIDPFVYKSVAAFVFEIMNKGHNHVISKPKSGGYNKQLSNVMSSGVSCGRNNRFLGLM